MELDRRKEDRRGRKALRDTIEGGTIDWDGKLWRLISRLVSVLDKALRYLVSYDAISMLGCSCAPPFSSSGSFVEFKNHRAV